MVTASTSYLKGNQARRPAWSYSKLKNFEACPKKHYHVDIVKDFKEPDSDQLKEGNETHEALAKRLSQGAPLPVSLLEHEDLCKAIIGDGSATVFVEQKLAITEQFAHCEFFDKKAWYRGIADVIKKAGPVALVIDWKTGKIKEDIPQLALMAACVFARYPDLQKIRTEFIWLNEDAKTTAIYTRNDIAEFWGSIWPRLETYEHAVKTTSFSAKPGFLCEKWCPVASCPHHGKRNGV